MILEATFLIVSAFYGFFSIFYVHNFKKLNSAILQQLIFWVKLKDKMENFRQSKIQYKFLVHNTFRNLKFK